MHTLLSGIVGSTAYGLAHEGSDVDRLGVFAVNTDRLHGLARPAESRVTKGPDITMHEAAKWCRLALAGNPTVMELVWLPEELYEVKTGLGAELIDIRSAFLSAPRVRNAYLGYATQQFKKLESRGDGTFSADLRNRTEKHARHLWRLCHQGLELYTTGNLPIRLENPGAFHEFGAAVARDPAVARSMLASYEADFNHVRSVLPSEPDQATVEGWLLDVRRAFYRDCESEREGDMGAREDYMTMRRAAMNLTELGDEAAGPILAATAATLRKASASETAFIRLAKAGVQSEMIDLAWAVIGESRPGGPAVVPVEKAE